MPGPKSFIYLILATGCWAYILVRSINLGITHDEALSWTILAGDASQWFTANNHWLNTALGFLTGLLSNNAPWGLRLPNLLAFPIFAWFVFHLTGSGKSPLWVLIPAWLSILCNHYVLELFGLFRGYGLALTALSGVTWYALQFSREKEDRFLLPLQIWALICLYSNYAFLYPLIGLFLFLIPSLRNPPETGLSLPFLWKRFRWFLALSLPAIANILRLRQSQELYFGGDRNLVADTLDSVLHYTFQFELFPDQFPLSRYLLYALLAGIALQAIWKGEKGIIPRMVLFCLALPLMLFYLAGMKFPMERSVLYLTLLIGVGMYQGLAYLWAQKKVFGLLLALLPAWLWASGTAYGAWYRYNFRYASTWYYDEHNPKVLDKILAELKQDSISVGISWVFEPSLNYYRRTRNLTRLLPLTRNPITEGPYSCYYIFQDELPLLEGTLDTLLLFQDTKTILVRMKPEGKEPKKSE